MSQENQDNHNLFFRLLSSYILFLYSVQVLTIGISLIHLRISEWPARAILGTSLGIALISLFITKGLPSPLVLFKRLRHWQLPFLGFLGIATLIYLVLWAVAIIMPDLSWDGSLYHIPTLSMWDVRGYIHWVNTNYSEYRINGFPKGAELLSYILVKAFDNSVINVSNLIFLPLGIISIAYIANFLGAGRLLSLCAGTAFLLIPVNINQSVTSYVDTAYASCAAGLIAILVNMSKKRNLVWKGIIIFGAALGLTLGTKSTGLELSGFAMLTLAGIWTRDVFVPNPVLEMRHEPRQLVKMTIQRLAFLLAIVLIALPGGGYWYIRNYIMTGTPFYPVGVTILGHTLFPGLSISETVSEYSMLPTQMKDQLPIVRVFYTWAQGFKAWPLSIKGYDSRIGGLGYLWLFACIPSIFITIFSFAKFTPDQKRSLLILVGVTVSTFIFTPENWWTRFTIWIYTLGLPCFALVLTNSVFNQQARFWRRLLSSIWMTLSLALLLFEAIYSTGDVIALASPGSLRSNLGNIFKPGTWNWPTNYLFPEMQDTILEDVLTQTGTVIIGPNGGMDYWLYIGMVGQLSQPIGARHLVFINELQSESGQIDLSDVSYIIWDDSLPLPTALASLAISITPAWDFLVLSLP
jgi:hypothetical protein